MTNTEWWEKINFSVAWEIPRKGNLIIQYLPTLLKAKTLLGYTYKKKSKVGCDNKQAKDSKKNGYLNFASVCGGGGELTRKIRKHEVFQNKWVQWVTWSTQLVEDLEPSGGEFIISMDN